jgi:hypothetical protein
MRKTVFATLLVGASMAAPLPALAWDYPGHRMVGAIADFVLSSQHPKAYDKIKKLLESKDADGNKLERTLSDVAVFPDCAKAHNVPYCGRTPSAEEKAYTVNNPHHGDYHFTDIPIQQTKYDPNSKVLEKYDVVKMINYAVAQLRKKSPQMDEVKMSDAEAVWLLAHLVGDIHQPLHVGAIYYDKPTCKDVKDPTDVGMDNVVSSIGGNNILLESSEPPPAAPPHDKLHLYWDGTVVNSAMKAAGWPGAEQDFARLLAASPPPDWEPKEQSPDAWATEWATEILSLAKAAHTKLKIVFKERRVSSSGRISCFWTTTISPSYTTWASQQARVQLAKAGFRLAALLAEIFKD